MSHSVFDGALGPNLVMSCSENALISTEIVLFESPKVGVVIAKKSLIMVNLC